MGGKDEAFLECLRVAFGVPNLESLSEMYSSTFGTSVYAGESLDLGNMERFFWGFLGWICQLSVSSRPITLLS